MNPDTSKVLTKSARVTARQLVDYTQEETSRLFLLRLANIPVYRWSTPMVDKFFVLARELQPVLLTTNSVRELDVNSTREVPVTTGDAFRDAQLAERKHFETVRPFVRMSEEGMLWVSPERRDQKTYSFITQFDVTRKDNHMWLVSPEDEQQVIRFAALHEVPVTAGAQAKHHVSLIESGEIATQLNLFDGGSSPTVTMSSHDMTLEDAGENTAVVPDYRQGDLLASSANHKIDFCVDYDGKDLFIDGVLPDDITSRLKQVPGVRWEGRLRRWAIDLKYGKELLEVSDIQQWPVSEDAKQAVADQNEKVMLLQREKSKARERSRALSPTETFDIPGLKPDFQPRPYQYAGIEVASQLKRAIIADDVGLGKTFQASATIATNQALPVIIVAKAGLKLNWHLELTDLFGWSTYIVEGRTEGEIPEVDAVIINPDLLKARLKDLKAVNAKGLVVDESHFLSNPRSQRSKALRALARPIRKDGGIILSLTATLMPNGKAMEVYPQLDMLGLLGKNSPFAADWDSFGKKYAAGYQAYGRLVVDTPIDDPQRGHLVQEGMLLLNEDLETHCMVRRSKKDAQPDLPDAQITPTYLDLDTKLWKQYQKAEIELAEFLAERAAEIAKELGENPRSAAVRARMQLEFSSHEQLQQHNALSQLCVAAKFANMIEWIDTFLTDNPKEKLLVFAHHRAVQAALAGRPIPPGNEETISIVDWEKQLGEQIVYAGDVAKKFQAGTILANADQKVQDVEKDKYRFQNDPNCRLMILSLGAGSEGHTLTAAWHIAFAQLPMTAKAFRQAVGRAYGRLNDPHPVWVHPLMTAEMDSIDHDTLRRINRKGAALDAVQDGIVTLPDDSQEDDFVGDSRFDTLWDIHERKNS